MESIRVIGEVIRCNGRSHIYDVGLRIVDCMVAKVYSVLAHRIVIMASLCYLLLQDELFVQSDSKGCVQEGGGCPFLCFRDRTPRGGLMRNARPSRGVVNSHLPRTPSCQLHGQMTT